MKNRPDKNSKLKKYKQTKKYKNTTKKRYIIIR